MAKKVSIEADECIGCQSCVEICPDVFEFDEDTEKALVRDEISGNEECIDEAAGSCPVSCIIVE